ncbi:MAG TPA: hypothetical protein VJA46_06460 [Acidimicrobiia bacterium]|nr:hypothetical protein [Acidimicrobiia bacterium]
MRRVWIGIAAVVSVLLAACSPGTASTTTAEATATTSTAAVSAEATVQVLLAPFSELGGGWAELFLPYGEAEDQLGTSPGGDGLMLGPEFGTQTPDGNYWILDAAKQRAAVFSADGTYLEQVVFPVEVLVDGQYFQYQMPQALDDGSIAVGGFRGEDSTALLRIVDGNVTSTTFEGAISWVTTDGTYLYGLSFEDATPYQLDPNDPPGVPVDWLMTRAGTRFSIVVQGDEIVVQLPDAAVPVTRTLQLRYSEDPEVIAHAGIEVETGIDGSIFILLYGAPESDETLAIGGFLTISPDGVVSEVEPIRNPFSPADTGSPAHLGVIPGTSTPWLMVVDEDGVRIYTRGD